jgi:hypothetical protein
MSMSLSLILRPTVSQPVYLGIKNSSGTYDQIFITFRHLLVCWYGALTLTRVRVCRLQLLLALVSTVILGSESCGTRDYILLSQIWDFPFCRLLRLAGLRWKYSIPPPHRRLLECTNAFPFITAREPNRDHRPQGFHYSSWMRCLEYLVFSKFLPGNRGPICDCVISKVCLPKRCTAMGVRSGSTVPAFSRLVTIFLFQLSIGIKIGIPQILSNW